MLKKFWGLYGILLFCGVCSYFFFVQKNSVELKKIFPSHPTAVFVCPNLKSFFFEKNILKEKDCHKNYCFFSRRKKNLTVKYLLSKSKDLLGGVFDQKGQKEFFFSCHIDISRMEWWNIKKKLNFQKETLRESSEKMVYYRVYPNFWGIKKPFYCVLFQGIFIFSSSTELLRKSLTLYSDKKYSYKHPQDLSKQNPSQFFLWSYFRCNKNSFMQKFLKKEFLFRNITSSIVSILVKDSHFNKFSVRVKTFREPSLFDYYAQVKFRSLRKIDLDPFAKFIPSNALMYYSQRFDHNILGLKISDFFKKFEDKKDKNKNLDFSYKLSQYIFPWLGDQVAFWVNGKSRAGAIFQIQNNALFWMFFDGFLKQFFSKSWKEIYVEKTCIASIQILNKYKIFLMPYGKHFFVGFSERQLRNNLKLFESQHMSLIKNQQFKSFFTRSQSKEIQWNHLFLKRQKFPTPFKNILLLSLDIFEKKIQLSKNASFSKLFQFLFLRLRKKISQRETLPQCFFSSEEIFEKEFAVNNFDFSIYP